MGDDADIDRMLARVGVDNPRELARSEWVRALGESIRAAVARNRVKAKTQSEKSKLGNAEKSNLGNSEKSNLGNSEKSILGNVGTAFREPGKPEKTNSNKAPSRRQRDDVPETTSSVPNPSISNPSNTNTNIPTSDITKTHTDPPPSDTQPSDILLTIRKARAKYQPRGEPKPSKLKARRPSAPKASSHRTQPPWRSLTLPDRVRQHHDALSTLGPACSMTLNLSPEIEAKARTYVIEGQREPNPLAYLHRRIRHELAAAGLPRAFWGIPEEAPVEDLEQRHRREALGLPGDQRLHVHGEITCDRKEADVFRRALRKACGLWDENRQFQVYLDHDLTSGWVAYTLKDVAESKITGSMFAATESLGKLARERYDEWRAKENKKIRGLKNKSQY